MDLRRGAGTGQGVAGAGMTGIKLGQLARDRISGFEGTLTRRLSYADGSMQFGDVLTAP